MINLTINAHDGNLYELTSRYNQPHSSAARIHRTDAYSTQRLISRLPIEADTWLQLLARINSRPAALHSYHASAVQQEVTNAVMRGDLVIYRLPILNAAHCLRGNTETGLCIIQGPKPHTATQLLPVPISTSQAAQALFDELGITTNTLLAYLNANDLYNSYDQQKPQDEILKRLANQELLAYKITLPPTTVPEKAVEYLSATGPGYDAVPLAPVSVARPVVAAKPEKKAPPQSLDEAQQRLIDAGPAVREAKSKGKALPVSTYSLADKQAVVESGVTERYMVRVVDSDYVKDDGYIAQKRDHGATIGWMAPLTMVEHGDTNAEALLNAFGTRHDPTKSYTVLIIDTQKMSAVADVQTIIPTNKNLQKLMVENPQITKIKPEITGQVLNEKFAPKYYQFAKGVSAAKVDQKDTVAMKEFAQNQGFTENEADLLLARHQLAKDVSAWEEFTGNGMTMDTNVKDKTAYGPVELVMLDKAPKTIGELKDKKAILSLAAS